MSVYIRLPKNSLKILKIVFLWADKSIFISFDRCILQVIPLFCPSNDSSIDYSFPSPHPTLFKHQEIKPKQPALLESFDWHFILSGCGKEE